MKTRTALPLLIALIFLIVSAGSVSAQKLRPATPDKLAFLLEDTKITNDFNDHRNSAYTIPGILSTGPVDFTSMTVKLSMNTPEHWIAVMKVDGNTAYDGDTFSFGPTEVHNVELILTANGDRSDTESLCISFAEGSKRLVMQCISLITINTTSAVSPDLPASNITLAPNPASSFLSLRGLDDLQAGYRYEIYSITGAEVRYGSLPSDARINVQDLSSGAYRLLLSEGKRTLSNSAFTVVH